MVERVTENTVREAPMTNMRLRAADHNAGEIRARALEGFGQALQGVAKQVDETVEKFDVAAAREADSADAIELAKIRARALSAVGTEAQPAAEQARKDAEELKRQRLTTLKGRRASMYSQVFDQRLASFEGQVTEHSMKQADVADRGAAAARAETSVQLAVDGYSDPKVWSTNLATAETDFRHANRGMAEDEINRRWAVEKSKANVAVVQSIMTLEHDDPLKAEKWLDDHASEITPEHEALLRKSLQPQLDDAQSDADFGRAMAFASGNTEASTPEGEDDHSAPTPAVPASAVPRTKVSAVGSANLAQHLVGTTNITNTAAQHRARGSGNALDIAAKEGTPIRPPMSGRVIKSWLDMDHGGGWSLLIQHPNGMVTGYAHMKMKAPVAVGDEVDSTTVVGSVGQTGHATGPHLHFTVRDAGQKIDPQTVDWAAVSGSGGPKQVDPTKVSWKEGELPRYTADKNLVGQAMDNVYKLATKENWSRQRYDRAIAKAKDFANVSEQAFNAQYDDLKDRVYEKIAGLDGGDGLTNVSQLGGDYGLLKGQDKLTITNLIQANKKRLAEGVDVKANGPEYSEWSLMSNGTPEERQLFLKQDFRADPAMTAAERLRLSERQQAIRNDQDGKLGADIDRVRGVVNRYAPEAGFKTAKADKEGTVDRQRRSLLMDRTNSLVSRRQRELGRPLNDQELDDIVRSQVISVYRDGEKLPLYIARTSPKQGTAPDTVDPDKVYASIPTETRDAIIRALQRSGQRPTPRLVIETYMRNSAR